MENLYTKPSKILRTRISEYILYITDVNEQLLLINDPNCHVIIFFMQYKFKSQSEIIYMDGTFEYFPKLFAYQILFSLHGLHDFYYCNIIIYYTTFIIGILIL